jgi:dihydroorotase
MYDLLLKGGRVIDPAQGLDGVLDVAFQDGLVAAIGADLGGAARQVRNVAGRIVTPGLIDMHAHVYWGATSLGVDAETIAKRSGTTTFVDAGSAGAGNFAGLRKFIVEPAAPRILAYLNISFPGIFGFSKNVMVGECEDLRLLDSRECLALAEKNLDLIVGIKARVGAKAGGSSGLAPLLLAIEVAEELDLPVMAHIDFPPPGRKEVLEALRPGDVLTHCFRPFPNAPVTRGNRIREDILEAHRRGIGRGDPQRDAKPRPRAATARTGITDPRHTGRCDDLAAGRGPVRACRCVKRGGGGQHPAGKPGNGATRGVVGRRRRRVARGMQNACPMRARNVR